MNNWKFPQVPEASPENLFRKKDSEFDNIPIEKLELSESIHNELKKSYNSVAQLLHHIINEDSFNVGRKGENEIRTQLSKKFGLIFKGKNVRYDGRFLYCQLPSLDYKQVA